MGLYRKYKAEILLSFATIIWGATFIAVVEGQNNIASRLEAIGAPDVSPLIFNGTRFVVATILFLLFFPKAIAKLGRRGFLAAFLLSLPFNAAYLLQSWGMRGINATTSAFITMAFYVAATPVLQAVFLRRRPKLKPVLGSVAVVVGALIIILASPDRHKLSFNLGSVMTIAAGVGFAVTIVQIDSYTKKHDPEGLNSVVFPLGVLFHFGVIALWTSAAHATAARDAVFSTPLLFAMFADPWVLWGILTTGALASFVCFFLLYRYQKFLSPTRAAILYSLEPLWAWVFAFIFAAEALTGGMYVGGPLIIAGAIYGAWERKDGGTPAPTE